MLELAADAAAVEPEVAGGVGEHVAVMS
jgi:hypothetical protein